ncbi:MAG TPA: hypothetical protein VE959_37985 [Bryobacteraceae bacterium]|nr:hypothetical protein [Bryobacteraceae bacterium]
MLKFLLLVAGGTLASAQQYSITTIAGGAPPATPAVAASTSIGQPRRVALDSAGNLYFSSGNSVFKMGSGGTLTLVAGNSRAGFSGDGGPAVNAQLNNPQGLAFDHAGGLYIADSSNNRIRIVTPDGIINTFAGTGGVSPGGARSFNDGGPATGALLHAPSAVAIDTSGNVYIADTGDNLIRIVTPDGLINAFAGDSYPSFLGDAGLATDAELYKPSDVAVDSSGNVYIADTANQRIRKVTTDGLINTIAGTGAAGYSGDTGPATSAILLAPASVTVDSSGNVYFADTGNTRIRKIDTSANISTVVGTGVPGFTGDGGPAINAKMSLPTGVAVDSSGNLYIADSQNLRIRKVASGTISTLAGNGVSSFSGDNGPATQAQMNSPEGVAVDSSGNIYIADTNNHEVRRVTRDGTIARFAGNGTAGFGGDGGAAASAQLNAPEGLAIDSAGNLYIADTQNARVRMVTAGGAISTVAGNGTPGFGGDGGAATGAMLSTVTGVAVDAAGNLYIADLNNYRVRKVSGGTIATVAGNGSQGYAGDGGAATSASLNLPRGVAVDAAGNLYIADSGNAVVRKVANGAITTIAGTGLPGFSGDGGAPTSAQLASPSGIAVDVNGSLIVADGAARIRKILFYGFITTIAGNGATGYSGDGGLAINAQINGATAVALDNSGNVYIADSSNNAVRMLQFTAAGTSISAVVNGASNQPGAIAPGEVLVLYGTGLGPGTLTQASLGANGGLPTALAGTSVAINGTLVPLLYTSAGQVGALVPFEVTGPTARVVAVYQGQTSAPATENVVAASPAIFTLDGSGAGQALAINVADGAVNGPNHPASAGSYVTLYATGAGQTNPAGQDGQPATVSSVVAAVTATIGGQTATVQYAGGSPGSVAGVIQVNLQVPAGLTAGAVPVVLQVGGASSQSGVTMVVQ